jgi:transcriptional regulator with XRE-family HTH domain
MHSNSLIYRYDVINILNDIKMITSCQIRAARALINRSARELAEESGVGVATIRRMELAEGVPSSNAQNLELVQKTLEGFGIEFIGTPEDRPGVRLITPKK